MDLKHQTKHQTSSNEIIELKRLLSESNQRTQSVAGILDLSILVSSQNTFMSAAMLFCNEMTSRYACDRVSLGWIEGGYVRLKAISRTEQFDRKTEIAQQLEVAMEESIDHEERIVWPQNESSWMARQHKLYSETAHVPYIMSVPIMDKTGFFAVCTFERDSTPFKGNEIQSVQLTCERILPQLNVLKSKSRWFGAAFGEDVKQGCRKLVGHEYTWWKVSGISLSLLLAYVCFVPVQYRVEADAIIRTKSMNYIAAPFEGYIDKVSVRPGDTVKKDSLLLALDIEPLLLEESSLIAEEMRYLKEYDKARAYNQLADMQISKAKIDQVLSRLKLLRYRIRQSTISAPFDATIVEGDLQERVGFPVQQGDVLFKLARSDALYLELNINEKDIDDIQGYNQLDVSFVTRPQDEFKATITLVEPSAFPQEKGNIVKARGEFNQAPPSWFKPGLTGVAKVNAGKRTLLWILTHKTVDFLRLKFWW